MTATTEPLDTAAPDTEPAEVERRPYQSGPDTPPVWETRQERAERILADDRLMRLRAVARPLGLTYQWLRELRMYRNQAEQTLTDATATDAARAEASKYLDELAIPAPVPDPDGQYHGNMYRFNEMMDWARQTRRLDEWYEPSQEETAAKPGRPPDGQTGQRRHRRGFAAELARLSRVPVTPDVREQVEPRLVTAVLAYRDGGMNLIPARERAVKDVASATGVDPKVVRKVLLLNIVENRD